MTEPWVCRIQLANKDRIAAVRAEPDIEAAKDKEFLWLRGPDLSDSMHIKLQSVADGPVFRIDNQLQLIPFAGSVPVEILPELTWTSLADVSSLSLPIAVLPQAKVQRRRLTLVRSNIERPAKFLLTNFSEFAAWSMATSDIRLQLCRFAVMEEVNAASHCNCMVKAAPLPPIAGQRFWLAGDVAIPLGFEWAPAVDESTLSEILTGELDFETSTNDIVLWRSVDFSTDDAISVISNDNFLQSSRQSIRRTLSTLDNWST